MSLHPDYRPCVGIMVMNRDGLVWLGRRADAPTEAEGPGTWWQMPQGGIDPQEDPRTAAVRELREETSIESIEIVGETADWLLYDLPGNLVPRAWGGRYRGQQQKWFLARFTGSDDEIDISPPGHPIEFDAWRWAAIDEVCGLIVPFKRTVYDQVVAAFRPMVLAEGRR